MATVTTTPLGKGIRSAALTIVNSADITVDGESKNVRGGPVDLFAVHADNMKNDPVTNNKAWVKLYDDISSGLVAGVTAPVILFPVPEVVVAEATGPTRGDGITSWECIEGFHFENGISVLSSQEDGNECAAAPPTGAEVNVGLVTSQ